LATGLIVILVEKCHPSYHLSPCTFFMCKEYIERKAVSKRKGAVSSAPSLDKKYRDYRPCNNLDTDWVGVWLAWLRIAVATLLRRLA